MRTEERWLKTIQPTVIKQFSPRIQKDLANITTPKLPKVIESTYLYGEVNTGKTIMAVFMLLELIKQSYLVGKTVEYSYISVPELSNKLKNSFNVKNQTSETSITDFHGNVEVLVLDDFGVEKPSDWILSELYLIINRRYENLKTTIITSNFSLKEIAERLGDDRITSRIERQCKLIKLTKTYKC